MAKRKICEAGALLGKHSLPAALCAAARVAAMAAMVLGRVPCKLKLICCVV